jgi:hypothetical protein
MAYAPIADVEIAGGGAVSRSPIAEPGWGEAGRARVPSEQDREAELRSPGADMGNRHRVLERAGARKLRG